TRQCLDAADRRVGGRGTVSHLYADEFLILTAPDQAVPFAQAALDEFGRGIAAFYTEAERHRGFIEGKTRLGRAVAYPFLNLVLAAASNRRRRIDHPGRFIQICRELSDYAKTLGGSRWVEDRRRDPPPAR